MVEKAAIWQQFGAFICATFWYCSTDDGGNAVMFLPV
jgi:hypothetical protein